MAVPSEVPEWERNEEGGRVVVIAVTSRGCVSAVGEARQVMMVGCRCNRQIACYRRGARQYCVYERSTRYVGIFLLLDNNPLRALCGVW